jgi:hypothetical protein
VLTPPTCGVIIGEPNCREESEMKLLERFTTAAVLVAAVLVIWVTVRDRVLPGSGRGEDPASVAQNLSGKLLPLPPGSPRGKSATVVLVVSSNCHFCSESMPFYRKLAGVNSASAHEMEMIAIDPENPAEGREYLSGNGVPVAAIISKPLRAMGFMATPTLVLLDKLGRVTHAWVGELNAHGQKEVLQQLAENCKTCKV